MFQKQIKPLFAIFVLSGALMLVNVGHTLAANSAPQTIVTFQDGVDSYSGTRDTYIFDVDPDVPRGSEITFIQDKNTNDERTSLLSFDLSSIPSGATITSAELEFYVNTEGQGFNMHRMLKSWDEGTITYTSNGGHFAADNTDAESAVDANWPGDDNYTGFITVSVPATTIQDWIDGTLTNNGWLMLATHADDGQQLRSREHATVAHHPKLTVEYGEPPNDPTATFQDGVDNYTGTRDTYIYDVDPETVRGSEITFIQDINTNDQRTSLLSFDLSSVPAGSVILSAELQFYVDTEGQGFNMHRMLQSWDEATISFTSNGGHFAADDNDAESTVVANWPGDDNYTGFITVAVPAGSIQEWLDGTLANNGWLMLATHASDGQQLRSREAATIAERPKLTLVFAVPVNPTLTITTSQLTRSNEVPGCIYNLYHSNSPYSGFTLSMPDIDTAPIDISADIGSVPDYYYVEANCGAGGTAVSNTVGEFSFSIVPGT